MKYRIEYEFEYTGKGNKHASSQDILDCIVEDAEEAITQAINDITDDVKKRAYRFIRL